MYLCGLHSRPEVLHVQDLRMFETVAIRVSFRGQNEIVWIIGGGGGQVCIHVQSMWQSRGGGSGACSPGKF